MAVRVWKTSQGFAALLAGAAVLALPVAAQAQERGRMDHDIAQSGGRDRESAPRPEGGRVWSGRGDGGMQRDRPAPPSPPVQQEQRRPAQSWSQPVPQAAPPPSPAPAQGRAYSTDNRGPATQRQQGWDGQRWNGQNPNGQNPNGQNSNGQNWNDRTWDRGTPAPRTDDRPRPSEGDRRGGSQWNGDRRGDGQQRNDSDRRWDGNGAWNGDRAGNGNRNWDRNGTPSWSNRGNSWSSRSDRNWNRQWREDRRYDWRGWRSDHRDVYRLNRYLPPYRSYSYRRLGIGFYLDNGFFGTSYWINDPWMYRLPPAYGPYRWVRYYDDAVMVNIYNGEVVDVIYDFFW